MRQHNTKIGLQNTKQLEPQQSIALERSVI